jgi:hypothetical protein
VRKRIPQVTDDRVEREMKVADQGFSARWVCELGSHCRGETVGPRKLGVANLSPPAKGFYEWRTPARGSNLATLVGFCSPARWVRDKVG